MAANDLVTGLPHEPLHIPRFLLPLKALVQKHIPSDGIDQKEPCGLKPESVVMVFPVPELDII